MKREIKEEMGDKEETSLSNRVKYKGDTCKYIRKEGNEGWRKKLIGTVAPAKLNSSNRTERVI